jgi:hypothetical protein
MIEKSTPRRLLIFDIDGLRQDVFHRALGESQLPNLGRLIGGAEADLGVHINPTSTTPSITFTAQTSIFTGVPPDAHGITGNQFFDRFGKHNDGVPCFYAFDIGDTLAVDDAVKVFTGKSGLIGELLDPQIPTLYECAQANGMCSTVAYNMISRGADTWIKPNLMNIARFVKCGGLLGVSAEKYDTGMVNKVITHLKSGGTPDVLTLYFMGLDHQSHEHGPGVQFDYLTKVVDPQAGRVIAELESRGMLEGSLAVIISDHGQIGVIPDDQHSLRMGFPFEREMGYFFDALGLDVHDFPGEDPNCDAVLALNGGLAHVYLQNRVGRWRDAPSFSEDVLRTAQAFYIANQTGRHAPDLHGALSLILVRDVQHQGWNADYSVFNPDGLLPLCETLFQENDIETANAAKRLKHLSGPHSGDLILLANYTDGFYFCSSIRGMHGGLHPEDSRAVLSMGWIGAAEEQIEHLRETVWQIADSCTDCASLQDMLPILCALFGWQ